MGPSPPQRLAALTGALLANLAAFHGPAPLVLLAPGLLSLALRGLSLPRRMLLAATWGVAFAGLFHLWAWQADRSGWLLILATRGATWALFPIPQWWGERGTRGPFSQALLCGVASALMAALLIGTPFGLDWDLPPAALAPWPWTLALLPWVGLVGVTALLGTLSHLLVVPSFPSQRVGSVALILTLLLSFALHRRPLPTPPLPRIGLVQTAWPQEQKWLDFNRDISKERLIRGTEQAAAQGASLVIWPETAWPVQGLRTTKVEQREVGGLAQHLGVQILASSWETDAAGWSNTVTQVEPGGDFGPYQAKRRLIPFQEYLPLPAPLEQIFRARGWYRSGAQFRPGGQPTVFGTGGLHYSVLICYESVVPSPARAVADQVDFLVVVTNDASLLTDWPKEAHFRSAILRAIEFRKPVLQAANSGVGGWIDERGTVLERAPVEFNGVTVLMVGGDQP